MNRNTLFVLLSASGILIACGKTETASQGSAPKTTSSDMIGIPECDEYITKWRDCINRMPGPAQSAATPAFRQTREAWKQTAATAEGKTTVRNACRAQLDALATNPACK